MNLCTCVQSFDTHHLSYYTSVYDHFPIYFIFIFQQLKIFITGHFYYACSRRYTISAAKFGGDCTRCYLFLATCNQNFSFQLVGCLLPDLRSSRTEICTGIKLSHFILKCLTAKLDQENVLHSYKPKETLFHTSHLSFFSVFIAKNQWM